MKIKQAHQILEKFLSSPERGDDCLDMDQLYGAIAATLSCPEYISDFDLGYMILGQEAKGADLLFDDEQIHHAWVACQNALGESLALDRFSLHRYYSHDAEQKEPSKKYSQWCDGYLRGYMLTEDAWQEAYEFLSDEGLPETKENHDALLALLATMADWPTALNDNNDPEKLQSNFGMLFNLINENVSRVHQLALILEENLMQSEENDEQIIRVPHKIGRNAPCPCGSGKKYKKCCLQ